jgi:hypothetical protein
MKIQNLLLALLLPGFGCWSQDQTTALLGKTNEGGTIFANFCYYLQILAYICLNLFL